MDFLSPLSNRLKELHLHSHNKKEINQTMKLSDIKSQQESYTILKKDSTASASQLVNNQ